jgi:amidase
MSYGLAIPQTAFAEATLIRYASAIEDLQKGKYTPWRIFGRILSSNALT